MAGRVVAFAELKNTPLYEIPLEKLQEISHSFEKDVQYVWDFKKSVEQYDVIGGTSTSALHEQIDSLRSWLRESNLSSVVVKELKENSA